MNIEKNTHLKLLIRNVFSYSNHTCLHLKQFILLFVLGCFNIVNLVYAGGPWTPGKNKGFAQAQFTFPVFYTKQLFLANGTKYSLPRKVGDYTFQMYMETGLSDKVSITMVLPAKYVFTKGDIISSDFLQKNISTSDNLSGLGNVELQVKQNFYNKRFLASGSIKVELPSGIIDSISGLYTAYPGGAFVPTIHIGKGFKNNLYAFTEFSYGVRFNKYSHEIRWLAESGKKLGNYFWVAGIVDLRLSMYNGSYYNFENEQTGLYSNNQEWFSYGLKVIYEYNEKIGVSASGYGAAYGNLSAKAPFLNVGTFIKW